MATTPRSLSVSSVFGQACRLLALLGCLVRALLLPWRHKIATRRLFRFFGLAVNALLQIAAFAERRKLNNVGLLVHHALDVQVVQLLVISFLQRDRLVDSCHVDHLLHLRVAPVQVAPVFLFVSVVGALHSRLLLLDLVERIVSAAMEHGIVNCATCPATGYVASPSARTHHVAAFDCQGG